MFVYPTLIWHRVMPENSSLLSQSISSNISASQSSISSARGLSRSGSVRSITMALTSSPSGEDWFTSGFSMASNDSQAPQAPSEAQRMQQLFISHGIDTDLYCDSIGTPPDLLQVISDINEGRSVMCYVGHGSPYEWETTGFNIYDISGLTNGRKQPWVYTIGCMNGMFNYFYYFCEAFLSEGTIADPHGALTIMGSNTGSRRLLRFRGLSFHKHSCY